MTKKDGTKLVPDGEREICCMLEKQIVEREISGSFPLQEKFVLRNGKLFQSQKLPKIFDKSKYETGLCFHNAYLITKENRDLRYVEGYAVPPDNRQLFHHAWVIDRYGRVIDPTWPAPEETLYYGIPIHDAIMRAEICGAAGVFEKNEVHIVGGREMSPINSEWMFEQDPELEIECERWRRNGI